MTTYFYELSATVFDNGDIKIIQWDEEKELNVVKLSLAQMKALIRESNKKIMEVKK